MKTIMITGPSSNSGKTTLTLGIIRALKNRGINISPFKTGPDFIDTKYLGLAGKTQGGNLDIHLMGQEGLKDSLSMALSDLAIVEGAMGYFDGIHNSYENSSYDMGKKLDIPAVLVYSLKGEMFSAIPKIKGMVDFQDSNIKGLILNKTSPGIYSLLKEQIERHIDIELLGYLPMDDNFLIEEKSLGLNLSKGENFIEYVASQVEKTIDLDRFIKLSKQINLQSYSYPSKRNVKIALAYDEAFNFYYRENINLLNNICHLEFFSPLNDKKIPKADLIYLGGGYTEDHRNQLCENKEMLENLRELGEAGQYILAESGGLIYLLDTIEDRPMVGLLKGKGKTRKTLDRFGYVDIEIMEDCLLGKKGDLLKGQEYHKTYMETHMKEIFNITKPMSSRKWQCGYKYKNILGYFQHINFLGNMKALNYLLDKLESERRN